MASGSFYPGGQPLYTDKQVAKTITLPVVQKWLASDANDIRDAAYDLRSGMVALSGQIVALQSGSFTALSAVLYPLSSAFYTSASIWNATSASAAQLSAAFYALSGNLNTSASVWNAVSSAFYPLSSSATQTSATLVEVSNSLVALTAEVHTLTGSGFIIQSSSLITSFAANAGPVTVARQYRLGDLVTLSGRLTCSSPNTISASFTICTLDALYRPAHLVTTTTIDSATQALFYLTVNVSGNVAVGEDVAGSKQLSLDGVSFMVTN